MRPECLPLPQTEAIGERLARSLKPGSVIALKGGLGAGKTCLVKGIARGLGISADITSPTYTIINEYPPALCHIDAYRLSGDEDFYSTGAAETIGNCAVTVIEWSERIPRSVPADAITVEIEITGPQNRIFRIGGMAPV